MSDNGRNVGVDSEESTDSRLVSRLSGGEDVLIDILANCDVD